MRRECLVLFLAATACADAHQQPECGGGRVCPDGLVCDPPHGEGLVARCVEPCGADPDDWRCDNGALCWAGRCSAGGTVGEGGVVRGDSDLCAFGLSRGADFTSEPLVHRCFRVCERDSDCPSDERCVTHACRPNCRFEENRCDPPNLCVDFGAYCVNPRRFARIDCDGDMDQDVECIPALVCDPEAIGGCTNPEPGTE